MDVYFFRHGDAGAAGAWKGRDEERPLSKAGAAQIEGEAAAMARLRVHVDMILTSPHLRARQTAEIVARRLHQLDSLASEERLAPGFGPAQLEKILAEHRDRAALLLVGHEPDFSKVISACAGGARVTCGKGSLARVIIDDAASLQGILAWLVPAEVLAR
jgi:phosphohistidine phosphatase